MLHKDILKKLMPVELYGDEATDLTVMGLEFDRIKALIDSAHDEIFGDTATETQADWERVLGLNVLSTYTIQERANQIVMKLRARGGLSKQYFIDLAAALGYTITITEFRLFRAGLSAAGDPVYSEGYQHNWQVNVLSSPVIYFRADMSAAGDQVRYEPTPTSIESIFEALKPAYTTIIWNYV